MKKIYLVLATFLIASVSFSQDIKPIAKNILERKNRQLPFLKTQLFTLSGSDLKIMGLTDILKDAVILEFDAGNVSTILSQQPDNINFIIPTQTGTTIELELYRSDIFTPDFTVITATSNYKAVQYKGGIHYRGIIKGDNNSVAAISIFDNEVMGIISSSNGNFVLGKLKNDTHSKHILYNDKNLRATNHTECFTGDDNRSYTADQLQRPDNILQNCIRLYWEVNYDIYQDKGSVTNAVNYVTGLFNQSAVLYNNDNIPVALSQVYVWNTPSPYTATSTAGLLSQFQTYCNSFNGDLGHLLGYAGGGGVAAGFSGLCASNLDNSQCYSGISASYANVPTFSWSAEVVTHEQGHLMGSRHTHACVWNGNNTAIDGCAGYVEGACSLPGNPVGGGTIMSYCHLTSVGINFNNGFGPQPAAVILNNYNNASCLTNCSGLLCFAPNNLTGTNVTTTTITLNWDSVPGAAGYNIRYRIAGTTTWTNATSPVNSYNAAGLSPGNNYEWQVQTVCSAGNSTYTQSSYFVTVPLTCNVPTNLNTTNISSLSALLSWTAVGGAVSYDIEYRQVGTITWLNVTSPTNSYTLSSIVPSTNYEWHVATVCSGGGISSNSIDSSFTTLSPAVPVACYPFTGNANDATGHGHDGTPMGATLTTDRFGNPNSAYLFNGVSDYINLGLYSNIIPSGNNFTMSVWIQLNQIKQQTILMVDSDSNNDRLNAMANYDFNGVSYTFWDYGNILSGGRLAIAGTSFSTAWEHYVYVVNGSQHYMEVYKNGALQSHLNTSSVLVNRNRNLRIGGAYDHANTPFFFDGKIDDMQIFDRALSGTEIQSLDSLSSACSPLPPPNACLVACYPFSGNANDMSGYNHNGIVNGATLTSDRFGTANSAYLFNGISDYINLGTYSSILPSGDDFSLSVWIRANQVKQQTILMTDQDANTDRLNAMAYYDLNGISYTIWDYGNILSGGRLSVSGTSLNSAWEHYVYLVNSSQHYMEVYKNGVLQSHLNSNSSLVNRNRNLRIGGAYDHLNTPFFFDGKIDDMRIYSCVLTNAEIQELYLQNKTCSSTVNINDFTEPPVVFAQLNNGNLLIKADHVLDHCIVELYSIDGKLIRSEKAFIASDEIEIQTSNISNGIYILALRGNDVNCTRKFCIIHN